MIAAVAASQAANPQQTAISFHFVHPGLPVGEYTLVVHPDGSGSYRATVAPAPPRSKYSLEQVGAPLAVEQTLHLPAASAAKLFAQAEAAHRFTGNCETRLKNIAFTGTKTLSFTSPDSSSACTFNLAADEPVAVLTRSFEGMATTLEEGRRLEQKHRFDRLSLDAELTTLSDAAAAGRATEIELIAPTLQSLADDPQVMERVRRRAAALLTAAATP